MTTGPTFYRQIRHRLEPVAWTHDPVVAPAASSDSSEPAPRDQKEIYERLETLSTTARQRCVLIAGTLLLPVYEEAFPDDLGPRTALMEMAADGSKHMPHFPMDELATTPGSVAFAAIRALFVFTFFRSSIRDVFGVEQAARAWAVAATGDPEHPAANRDFLARWWSRCRALLPVRDPADAELEWDDFRFPPHPHGRKAVIDPVDPV